MVRLYWGTGGSDYTEVSESEALAIRYERTIITDHIPYSNRVVSTEQGYQARIAFSTFMKTTATRDALLGHLPDVYKVSVDSGTSYRLTTDVGHEVRREWLDLWPVDLDLLCDADALSATLHSEPGGDTCLNLGNRPSTPTFVITVGTEIAAGLTISDGTRTLILTGIYHVADILTITNWKALQNADEVTLNMSGEFPVIPAGDDVTFTFTGITAPATEVVITYRDTWR
jgi:hypothetical protein